MASLSRSRRSDDPELVKARRDLLAAKLEAHIERTLAVAPPLTDEQRQRLAGLFAGGAGR